MSEMPEGERRERGGPVPFLLPTVLALLLAALLATSAILLHDRRGDVEPAAPVRAADEVSGPGLGRTEGSELARSAVVVARRAAVAFFTVDHRTIDEDADRLRSLASSTYRTRYDALVDAGRREVMRQRLVATARLPRDSAATEYLTEETAQVLVAVDVRQQRPGQEPDRTAARVRIDLQRVSGSWLVSDVERL